MRYSLTQKFGFFSLNILVNASLMNEAVKANSNYNKYLEQLTYEEKEKLCARDWYLKKNGRFYGSGFLLGERSELNAYNAMSDNEKERILIQYRWNNIKR